MEIFVKQSVSLRCARAHITRAHGDATHFFTHPRGVLALHNSCLVGKYLTAVPPPIAIDYRFTAHRACNLSPPGHRPRWQLAFGFIPSTDPPNSRQSLTPLHIVTYKPAAIVYASILLLPTLQYPRFSFILLFPKCIQLSPPRPPFAPACAPRPLSSPPLSRLPVLRGPRGATRRVPHRPPPSAPRLHRPLRPPRRLLRIWASSLSWGCRITPPRLMCASV